MFDIVGKVALVTGSASGIGLSAAKELLRNGLKGITLTDINEASGPKVLKEIEEEFGQGKAIFFKLDVANKHQFEDAFNKTIQTFRHLDILINNAGICKESKWEEEIAVNFAGTVNGTVLAFEEYLPKHKSGSEGVILNVASIAALDVMVGIPVYTGTKHAVVGLTRSFGHELNSQRNHIRVIAICPGFTATPILIFNEETFLGPSYFEAFQIQDPHPLIQPSTCVAKAMIQIIKHSESGSVWVSEDEKPPYQIEFRSRLQSRKLNSNINCIEHV